MGVTNFPDGINAGDAAGNAADLQIGGTAITASAIVNALAYQSSGKEVSAGTVVVPAGGSGTAFAVSGLSSVDFVVASPYGALSSTAGTVGGFVSASSEVKAAGVLLIRGNDQMGTASTVAGTASWIAIGT